jgi:hypothetical protein
MECPSPAPCRTVSTRSRDKPNKRFIRTVTLVVVAPCIAPCTSRGQQCQASLSALRCVSGASQTTKAAPDVEANAPSPFPSAISFRLCLSHRQLLHSRFNLPFSFSSSLARFAWSPCSFRQRLNVRIVISDSMRASGMVFRFAMPTSICHSIVTICSGLYLLIGIASFSANWILSRFNWYKSRRSRHLGAGRRAGYPPVGAGPGGRVDSTQSSFW